MSRKSLVTSTRKAHPKQTLMDRRVPKKANKTGKQPMVYPRGCHK